MNPPVVNNLTSPTPNHSTRTNLCHTLGVLDELLLTTTRTVATITMKKKIGFKIPRILLTVDLLHSIHIPMVLRPPTVQMIFLLQ